MGDWGERTASFARIPQPRASLSAGFRQRPGHRGWEIFTNLNALRPLAQITRLRFCFAKLENLHKWESAMTVPWLKYLSNGEQYLLQNVSCPSTRRVGGLRLERWRIVGCSYCILIVDYGFVLGGEISCFSQAFCMGSLQIS